MDKYPRLSFANPGFKLVLLIILIFSFGAQAQRVNLGGQFWIVRDRGPEQMVNRLPVPVNVATPGHYQINGFILYNSGNHQLNESFFFTLEDAAGNEITPVNYNAKPLPYTVVKDDSVEGKHLAWRDGGIFYIPQANTNYTLIINHYARIWDRVPYFLNPRIFEASGRNAESLNIQQYELINVDPYDKPELDGPTDLGIDYTAMSANSIEVNGEVFPAVEPGGTYNYQVDVENTGPNDLPTFRTWVDKPDTVELSNFNVEPSFFAFGKYIWDLGALNTNEVFNITFDATAANSVTDMPYQVPSLAGVYSEKDTLVENNFDSTTVYIAENFIPQLVDISVGQFAVTDSMIAEAGGDTIKYVDEGETYQVNITLTNNSLFDAQNVTLNDTLPANVVASGFNISPQDPNAAILTWVLPTLALQSSRTFQFLVTVPATLPVGTTLFTNSVFATAENEPADSTGNNTASETVIANVVPKIVDLGLSQIITTDSMEVVNGDSVKYVKEGEIFPITLIVNNPSPFAAENVVLGSGLPAGLEFANYSITPNLVLGDSAVWNLGNIPAGGQIILEFEATVPADFDPGDYTFTSIAEVTADNEEEATTSNNTVSGSVVLNVPPDLTDISVEQIAFTDSTIFDGTDTTKYVMPGDVYRIRLAVKNDSDFVAENVVLDNVLPENVTLQSSSVAPATTAGRNLQWQFPTIPANGKNQILLTLLVSEDVLDATNLLPNQVNGSAGNEDPAKQQNNSSVDTVFVVSAPIPPIDVALQQMTFTDSSFFDGQDTLKYVQSGETYQVKLSLLNVAGNLASNVVLTNNLPPEANLVSAEPAPTTTAGQQLVWDFPTLGAREIKDVLLTLQATDTATDSLINAASVIAAGEDPATTADNQVNSTVYLYEPAPLFSDVRIRQIVLADSFRIVDGDTIPIVKPGETYEINIIVTNLGPIDATGLVITDIFPDSGSVHDFSLMPNVLNPNSAVWNLANLPGYEEQIIKLFITMPDTMPEGDTPLPNEAKLIVANEDPANTGDNNTIETPICVYQPDEPIWSDVRIQQIVLADSFRIVDGDTIPIVKPGETYEINIIIANLGPIDATGLVITDNFPDSGSVHDFSLVPNILNPDSAVWNLGTLPGYEEQIIKFFITMPDTMPEGDTPLPNEAKLVVANEDPANTGDNNTVETPICVYQPDEPIWSDVRIRQIVLADSFRIVDGDTIPVVKPGETYEINIIITNLGPIEAEGLAITDVFPDSGLVHDFSLAPDILNPDSAIWNLATLPGYEEQIIKFFITMPDTMPEGDTPLPNEAKLVVANEDPDKTGDNNTIETPICVYQPDEPIWSDVRIRQIVIADSFRIVDGDTIPIVKPGETYEINIIITNLGPINAEGLVITDVFPDSGTVHDFSLTPNILDPDSAIWNLTTLPGYEERIIKFFITMPELMPEGETPLPNKAKLIVANEDPNKNGDNETTETPICVNEPKGFADIIIIHEVFTGEEVIRDGVPLPFAKEGETIQFRITVRNLSDTVPGLNVNLKELIDELLIILGYTDGGSQDGQTISWIIPVLDPNGEQQFFINAQIPDDLPEGENTFENEASVTADNQTPEPGGDTRRPIRVYNQVYPAIEASIRTIPETVDVGDSIYVDVQVSGPIQSYDIWVYLPNGEIDSTFANGFVAQSVLMPNQWESLIPAFIIEYLITTAKEDPVTFEIRAIDMDGNLVTAQATSTIKSGNYLVLDRNVYKAEEGEPLGIRFKLSNRRKASLDIYTINGRHITQISQDVYEGGWNEYPWNGLSDDGQKVGSGVYIVTLRSGEFNDYKKFILVR